ncbi:DNA polymerase III subunit delta [Aerococcaceae bacterium WGS1372]
MDFQAVMQNLNRGQLHQIYTLIGEEGYLKQQFMEKLYEVLGGIDNLDISKIDLQELTIDHVLDEAEMFSFFSDYRLLIVFNASFLNAQGKVKLSDKEQKRLLDYIENPNTATIIVFNVDNSSLDKRKKLTKSFNKNTMIVDISNLDETQVSRYVQAYIKESDINYTREAINELLIRVNYQLTNAMVEIEKLELYAQSEGRITIDTVRTLVARTLESDVFQLSNAIADKNISRAIQIYQDLILMKHEPIALHALMVSQFRVMVQSVILARTGLNQADIAKQLGIHPYRVKLAIESVRSLQFEELLKFYAELSEADFNMKTGFGDKETYFYILLTKLANLS